MPDASKSQTVISVVMVLGLAAILYGAIMALIQPDFRRRMESSGSPSTGPVVLILAGMELTNNAS